MKKLLLITLFFGALYAWFYFSNPKGKAAKEPLSISSIDEVKISGAAAGHPTQVYGLVTVSVSGPAGGFFVIEYDNERIVVLSRTITPVQGKIILAIIVPRPVAVLQGHQAWVAALVDYKTIPDYTELTRLAKSITKR